MASFIFGGDTGETQESLKRKRAYAEALRMSATDSLPKNEWEGLAAVARAIAGKSALKDIDRREAAGREGANAKFNNIAGALAGPKAFPAAPGAAEADGATDYASHRVAQAHSPDIAGGIASTAQALGIDPVDLATAISYETGGTFDPTKEGPTTQWGQHKGLIQFGEPQAQKYGVDWNDPVASQLGPDGAVAGYLRDTGVKPGMGLMDIYSAINAGGVGRYGASDANNGGAPGTVADKVNQQMAGHRQKAMAIMNALQGGRQQVAQAGPMSADQIPVMAGGNAGAITRDASGGPDMQMLMGAAGDGFMNEGQQSIIQALMKQKLAQSEPANQLDMQYRRAQIEALGRKADQEGFTLGEGQVRYDAKGNIIAKGGDKSNAPTVQKLKLSDGSEMAVQWNQQTKNWDPIDAPAGGAGIQPRTKLTENQSKMTLFQSLQTETQPVLLDLEKQFNPANIADAAARSTPIAGNFFQSEQGQIYQAAATAWAEGALRIATGAAATPEEMERTKKAYFAQPGDTPVAIAFKAQMRDMYNRAIQRGLGEKPDGGLPLPSQFMKEVTGKETVAPPAPEGVPADLWDAMTPEERALWN